MVAERSQSKRYGGRTIGPELRKGVRENNFGEKKRKILINTFSEKDNSGLRTLRFYPSGYVSLHQANILCGGIAMSTKLETLVIGGELIGTRLMEIMKRNSGLKFVKVPIDGIQTPARMKEFLGVIVEVQDG